MAAILVTTISPAMAQPVPEGNVELDLFGLASHNWPVAIEKFEAEYPNIKVTYTSFGTDEMKQALRVGASSGDLPEMWWNWGGSLASPYIEAGYVMEWTPEMLEEYGVTENVSAAALDIARYDGRVFGIPNKVSPFGFIYRKSILEERGLAEPTTFAELETLAETLKADGITPFSVGGKFSWMTMRFFDFFLEHHAGPEGHDALLDGEVSWDGNESVIWAFTKLKEWNDKGYFPEGFLNVDPATNMTALYNGSAAIVFDNPSLETSRILREGYDPNDYGTFLQPTEQDPWRVPGSPSQIQINAKNTEEQKLAAMLFATWAVRPENAPVTAEAVGYPSATKGILPEGDLPIQQAWADWTQNEVGYYRLTDQGLPQDVVAAFFEAQDSLLLDLMSPEDAAAEVQSAIERYQANNS